MHNELKKKKTSQAVLEENNNNLPNTYINYCS